MNTLSQLHSMERYQHKLHLHKLLPSAFDAPAVIGSEEWLKSDAPEGKGCQQDRPRISCAMRG
jgi:hypothetical protein